MIVVQFPGSKLLGYFQSPAFAGSDHPIYLTDKNVALFAV
jgi:hypothetical protein